MKNTVERTKATNEFEKDFYKLMNNSVYGKTMENVRNRINFKLVSSEEKAMRLRNSKIRCVIFNDNLVGVHLCKKQVTLNKPIYIGQNVLDQSKYLMYNFHYNVMLKNFDKKDIDLLFTDTDSLCYHIKNKDPFEFMKNNSELFDLSNYPKNHEMYDHINNKVIEDKKKNDYENFNNIIDELNLNDILKQGLEDNKIKTEHKKAKGVKACALKKQIKFENYKTCLFDRKKFPVNQNGFKSDKHIVYTEKVNKVALSYADDKCFIDDNMVDTYTIGHYKTKK
jgi:hypothetical protein